MKTLFKNPFFYAGVACILITIVIEFLRLNFPYSVLSFLILMAFILLIFAQTRNAAKGFLIGIFGPLILVGVGSFLVTFILIFINTKL